MIVEPVPTEARTRRRRVLAVLLPLVPAVLLIGVVGAALVGRDATPPPSPAPPLASAGPSAVALVATPRPSTPAPTPPTGPTPQRTAGTIQVPPPANLPHEVAGLPVLTVQQLSVDALAPPGLGRDAPVAVWGYLGIFDPPAACNDPSGPLGPLCDRTMMLTAVPWVTSGGGVFGDLGPHLHPRFPPGVALPDAIAQAADGTQAGPVPVALIGRVSTSGVSCDADPMCEPQLTVESVAWAGDRALPLRAVVDPSIQGIPADWIAHDLLTAVREVGMGRTPLGAMLLPTSHLGLMDPVAAAAAQLTRPGPGDTVWYVRALDPRPDPRRLQLSAPGPHVEWVVLDAASYRVLATGVPDEADGG